MVFLHKHRKKAFSHIPMRSWRYRLKWMKAGQVKRLIFYLLSYLYGIEHPCYHCPCCGEITPDECDESYDSHNVKYSNICGDYNNKNWIETWKCYCCGKIFSFENGVWTEDLLSDLKKRSENATIIHY